MTRMRLSTTDTSFGDLIGSGESSSKVDDEAERTSWLAAIESPERSETEPEGTIDGGFDWGIKVPPKLSKNLSSEFERARSFLLSGDSSIFLLLCFEEIQ